MHFDTKIYEIRKENSMKTKFCYLVALCVFATSLFAAPRTTEGRLADLEDRLDDIEFQSGLDKIKFGLDFSTGGGESWYKISERYNGTTLVSPEQKYSAHNKWGMELHLNMNAPINDYTKFYGRLSMAKNYGMMDTNGVHQPLDIDAGRDLRSSGQSLYVTRAYVDLFLSKEIVATLGRQPGTDGPGSNLRNNALRQATYPALLFNTLGDAAVISYKPRFLRQLQFVVRGAYGKIYQADSQGVVRDWTSKQDALDSDLYYASMEIQPYLGSLGKNSLIMLSYTRLSNLALEVPTNMTMQGTTPTPDTYKVQNLGDTDLANLHFESYQAFGLPLNYFVSGSYMKGSGARVVKTPDTLVGPLKTALLGQLKFNEETAFAVHAGLRYDFHRYFKLGGEYFYGSQYWYTVTRASFNDPLNIRATRGQAFDVYVITQLDRNQFFRLSYTHIQNKWNNRGLPFGGAYGTNDEDKAKGGFESTADNVMLIYNVKF